MHARSISTADGDDAQSTASDSHLFTCSTEAEPDEHAREEKQGKGSTNQSSHEVSEALPQEYATVDANLPIIIDDESDTNRKRKPAEGSISLCIY